MVFESRHSKHGGTMKRKNIQLNLGNPTQVGIIKLFSLTEGRMTKADIIAHSNKAIFYRMKNGRYITECPKGSGNYKATVKLKKLTMNSYDKAYNNGCSNKHSKILLKASGYIPQSVIAESRFKGQNEIKSDAVKYMATDSYKSKVNDIKQSLSQSANSLKDRLDHPSSYQDTIDTRRELETTLLREEIINSSIPFYTPDIMVTVTRDEAYAMQNYFSDAAQSSPGNESQYMEQNSARLQDLLKSNVSNSLVLGIEAVTNTYGEREIIMHENYQELFGIPTLYIL